MGAMKQAMLAELPGGGEVEMYATAEHVAQAFHETYERLAPQYDYRTREASAKPWADVPERNKVLMIAVVAELLERGVVDSTDRDSPSPTPGG